MSTISLIMNMHMFWYECTCIFTTGQIYFKFIVTACFHGLTQWATGLESPALLRAPTIHGPHFLSEEGRSRVLLLPLSLGLFGAQATYLWQKLFALTPSRSPAAGSVAAVCALSIDGLGGWLLLALLETWATLCLALAGGGSDPGVPSLTFVQSLRIPRAEFLGLYLLFFSWWTQTSLQSSPFLYCIFTKTTLWGKLRLRKCVAGPRPPRQLPCQNGKCESECPSSSSDTIATTLAHPEC